MPFLRRLPSLLLLTGLLAISTAHASFDEALGLYQEKRYPEARVAFTKVAAAEPQNPQPRYYLGSIAMRRNDTDDAIHHFEKAVELAPDNSVYHMELGGAYGAAARKAGLMSQMRLAKRCCAALEKAVALDPDNLNARNGLISFYRQAPGFVGGGIGKAYRQAEEIRKRDFHRGSLILGQLYASERRFDESFTVAREMLAADPDSYLGHYSIGRLAAESGERLDEGEKALRHCLTLTPAKDEPHHAAVHWRLGNIAEKRRDPATARAAYTISLQLDPSFKAATDSLAKLK
jgi:tetratricopeptide (TPR) repeat protein